MSERICRWGILGAADIARKNWQGIRHAPNCTLVAVASRDLARCRQFIQKCQAHVAFDPPPEACDSYDDLLARNDVDAVYIPLPTLVRKQWVIRAAEAGKHVLAEKPTGGSADDVREILAACRANGVQYMDGVMFLHSRRLDAIRKVLDDGQSIGPLKRIASHFTFGGNEAFFARDIRTRSDLEPFGCLGDLGWYNLCFTLWVMQWKLPARVCAHMLAEHRRADSPDPVPVDFSAELFFDDGVSAHFYCSFVADLQQWASVGGTKGSLWVRDFVLPFFGPELAFEVSNPAFNAVQCDFNMEDHTQRVAVSEYSNAAPGAQESRMFGDFASAVLSGKPELLWGENALKIQQVLDACLQSAHQGGVMVELPNATRA